MRTKQSTHNNTEDKLRRRLIWKYFWKRKREEVWAWLKEYCPFILLIIFMTLSFFAVLTSLEKFLNICFLVILVFIVCFILWLFYDAIKEFINWLRQNWEWATKDADKELKRKRKK